MIIVVETIRAMPEKREELKKALLDLVPLSQKSKGNLQYDLRESLDEGNTFCILMAFETLDDLRSHESSEYIAQFVKKYENILYDDVQVSEWKELRV